MSRFLRFFRGFVVSIVCAFGTFAAYSATSSSPSNIMLDDQGATITSVPSVITGSGDLPLQSLPYKPGYLYAGHFTQENCYGDKWIDYDGAVPPALKSGTTPSTLYACWVNAALLTAPSQTSAWGTNFISSKKVFILNGNGGNSGAFLGSNQYVSFGGYATVTQNGVARSVAVTFQNRGDWIYWGRRRSDSTSVWFIPNSSSGYYGPFTGLSSYYMPSRSGYVFGGYFTNENGTGVEVISADNQWIAAIDEEGVFTQNLYTIYAKWNRIRVNLSGTGVLPSTVYLQGDPNYWYSAATGGSVVTVLTNPPSNGTSTFAGYYTGQNGSGTPIVNANGTFRTDSDVFAAITQDNTTLYPRWTNATWATLTINDQDETTASNPKPLYYPLSGCSTLGYRASQSCDAGTVDSITPPVKNGWVYGGHYASVGGAGTQYISNTGDLSVIRSSLPVYAKWTFNVGYGAGTSTGGVAPSSPNVCVYGTTCNAPANTYTNSNANMEFAGWSCSLVGATGDCAQSVYLTGQSLLGATNNVSGATGITLTPIWASTTNYWKLTLKPNNNTQTIGQSNDPYIYEAQGVGFYVENNTDNQITASIFASISEGGAGITMPQNSGKIFDGYYTRNNIQVIDKDGFIQVGPSQFTSAVSLVASWRTPDEIQLSAGQYGNFGDCSVDKIYVVAGRAPLPGYQQLSCGPTPNAGYGFNGYYANGIQYYNNALNAVYEEWPTSNAPIELVAQYSPILYAVKYYCGAVNDANLAHTDYVANGQTYTMWDGMVNGAPCVPSISASSSAPGTRLAGWQRQFPTTEYALGQNVSSFQITGDINLISVSHDIFYVNLVHVGYSNANVPLSNTPSPNNVYFWNGNWYDDGDATSQIMAMSPAPIKIGYKFDGYYNGQDGNGTQVVDSNGNFIEDVPVNTIMRNDTNIFANWEAKPYTIQLNRGAGTGGYSYIYYRADFGWAANNSFSGTPIPSITPPTSPTGQVFSGYYTGQDGGGTPVTDGDGTILVTGTDALTLIESLAGGNTNLVFYAKYDTPTVPSENEYFAVTTKPMNANTEFRFAMSAAGQFYIDWGDGKVDSINRVENVNPTQYKHTYTSASGNGGWTIKIWGSTQGYNSNQTVPVITFTNANILSNFGISNNTSSLVAGISGSLGFVFPTINNSIPSFYYTFYGCGDLVGSIPENLFGYMVDGSYVGVTGSRSGMFYGTFYGTGLTGNIPGTLFGRTVNGNYYGVSGAADWMFAETFRNTNIVSISSGLFSGIAGAAPYMFYFTFGGTNITSLPGGLFSGVTGTAEGLFEDTFRDCSNLSGYIPKNFFNLTGTGLQYNANNSMMTNVFAGTNLATSCDSFNLTHYQTGYDNSYWNGKVICAPAATFTCEMLNVGGTPTGVQTTIWVDEITNVTPLPDGNCTAPAHYGSTNYWKCTGSNSCDGNHWAGSSTIHSSLSWLESQQTSVSFYKEYTPDQYTITLKQNHDSNDNTTVGTVTETYATSWSQSSATLPATWAGHTFSGYYTARDGGVPMTDENGNFIGDAATFMIGASGNWYAHWSAGPYTVTFKCEADGAAISGYDYQNIVQPGNTINVPAANNCSKTGYTFSNWKIVANNGSIANTATTYTWDHYFSSVIIPNWQPVQKTIALDANGGTWGSNVPNAGQSVYTIYDIGVYRDVARIEQMGTSSNPWQYVSGSQNDTLSKSITLTYDLGGNDATLTTGGQTYTGSASFQWPLGFAGFYNANNGGTQMIRGRVKENGTTEDNPGYITPAGLNGNSGGPSYTTDQIWYAHWSPITFAPPFTAIVPERAGYVFLGYYTAASGGDRITDGGGNLDCADCVVQTISADTTFYAHWQACSHDFEEGTTPHASKENMTALDGMCRYHITCINSPGVTSGNGYTQYGGSNTTDNWYVTIAVDSTSALPGCFPRTYNIIYENVTEHNGTMPASAPSEYTYGEETEINETNAKPTSSTDIFSQWCTNIGLTENCATTQTIGTSDYDEKIYYAKWSNECQPGYTRYDYATFAFAFPGYASASSGSNVWPSGACVPARYIVNCHKNCDGDTCAACLEDFYITMPFSGITNNTHFGGAYNIWDLVGSAGYTAGSGYVPVNYVEDYNYEFYVGFLDRYERFRMGDMKPYAAADYVLVSYLYSGGGITTGNYITFMNNLSGFPMNNGIGFGREHYTFGGLWTAADGGIPYIDGNGNFANGNGPSYSYLPWPVGFSGLTAETLSDMRAFQNFFFDNQVPVSTSPLPLEPYTFDVYAHWVPHIYSVKLMRNHSSTDNNQKGTLYEEYGNGWLNSASGTFVANYQLPSDLIPSWTGYTFNGYWTTRDDSGTQVVEKVDSVWKVTANAKTLVDNNAKWYAHWTPDKYTIALDNANALVNGTASLTSIYDSGAYLNVNGTLTLMDEDNGPAITLPEHKYTVSFDLNYDGAPNGPVTEYPGWTFNGYFSSVSSNATKYIAADGKITQSGTNKAKTLTADATWKAQWTQVANLTLPEVYNSAAGYFGQPGYVFTGWWTTANDSGVNVGGIGDAYNVMASGTLYAHWAPCTYTGATNATSVSVSTADDNSCVYTITCPANYACDGNHCTIYGEPNSYATVTLPECVGAGYTITYYDNPAYGTNVLLATQNYTYDPNNPVMLDPTLPGDVWENHHAASVQWCDIDGNNCKTQLSPQEQNGNKTFYAKWTCATGYTTESYPVMMSQMYDDNNSWYWTSQQASSGYLAAGTCVPIRYHINCHKNCDGDTCAACLEDFRMKETYGNNVYNWQFGGGYNVKEFFAATGAITAWVFGGFNPVRQRVSTDPACSGDGSDFYSDGVNGVCIESDYVWASGGYPGDTYNSDMLHRLYELGTTYNNYYFMPDFDSGNYKHFLQELSGDANNPTTNFGREHYTFDGLWTAADGGIQYIDGDGNFANGNGTAYSNLPWPSYEYNNYDARAFQNFFFDSGIAQSSTSPYTFDVYAHWVPHEYTINLDKNADDATYGNTGLQTIKEKWGESWRRGTGAVQWFAASQFTIGQTSGYNDGRPTRSGYNFMGYYTEQQQEGQSCPGTQIIKADGTMNLSATSTVGDVEHATYFDNENGSTIYACWESLTYNISYTLNGGTAGTDQPTSATYGDDAFHVSNPVSHQHGTFKGWVITEMDNGVTHRYGQNSSVSNTTTLDRLDLTQITNGTSMQYFKDLRGSAGTVTFTANWECNYPYLPPDCSATEGVKVTVNAGAGIATIAGVGDGWVSENSGSVYKYFAVGTHVTLANVVTPGRKAGYTATGGYAYTKTSGFGTLNNGIFTVGDGDAVISVAATGITTPEASISGGATKVYNYQSTTLTGAVNNGTDYDSGISFTYRFGVSGTSDGTYDYTSSNTNTKTIAKDAYLDTKYHKVEITAHGEGGLASSAGVSATPAEVTLKNAPIRFNVGTGETLGGSSPLYAPYNVNGNLYSGEFVATTDTPATVPNATKNYYNFAGWWTSNGTDPNNPGQQVYDADGTLTSNNVSGYVSYADGETKWVVTSTNGKDLYPRWDGKIYMIVLRKNGATDGTSSFYEKYGSGYASSSNPEEWNLNGITVPTRTGYTFGGYYANNQFAGSPVIGTDGALPDSNKYFTSNTALYAKWTANTYNISYNINGGTAGTDQPETATYDTAFHVDNPTPTGHQTSFAGWRVTRMQSGVEHFYGASSSNMTSSDSTSWDYTTITPDVQYFKNLRANADTPVIFTAVWNCEYPYLPPACSGTSGVKVTVEPGAGVATISGVGDGWVSDGSGSVYKYFDVGTEITLSEVVSPALKLGYTATSGYAYTKTSGAGTLSNGTFVVSDGDAVISVAATGVKTPVPTISGGVTQIYNYQDVTLVGTLGNSTDYGSDSGISFAYQYGYSTSSDGAYGNWTTSPTVGAAAFHGTRYYKAKITASGEGGLSATGTSSNPTEVTLTQRTVTFNPNGGTLGDSSGRYIRYNSSDLYTTATSDTTIVVPTVTRNYYTFDGWWTTDGGDSNDPGQQIYDANGNLTTTPIAEWTGEYGWAATQDRTLYARWNGNVYKLNLNKNGGTNGSVTVLNERYGTGWRVGTSGNFNGSISLSGNKLPTKTGYTFVGYYDEATNGNPKGTFENGTWTTPESTAITGTTTWYAHWSKNQYTVTYACGLGDGAGSTDTATYDNDYTPKYLGAANCETSLTGYYFNGWNVTPGSDIKPAGTAFQWKYTENKTFTARWVAKTYHITFDKNNGNGGTNEVWEVYGSHWHDASYNHMQTIILPNKTGHTFAGYALNGVTYISGTTLPEPTLTFGDTSNDAVVNVTLTAQWTPITYNIYYDENGGSRTLPAGYTMLDYIDTVNTAGPYINTGVAYDSTKEIVVHITAQANTHPSSDHMLALGFSSNAGNWLGVNSNGKWAIGTSAATNVSAEGSPSDIKVRWNGGTEYLTIGNYSVDRTVNSVPSGSKLALFGRGNEGKFKGKIYMVNVSVDGEVVRSFVPAKNSSNVVGMYDTVTGTFFTNAASSGSFTAGTTVDMNTALYPNIYTYGVGATVYGVPTRAHSVFEGWCRTESAGNTFTDCAMPHEITTTDIEDKLLHAKWSCDAGYNDTGSACVANTIILDWNENNGNYPELPNGQCTYGGNLILPGEPNNSSSLVFNGWKLVNNDYVAGGDTVTGGCVETYTGVTSGTSTDITAQWCNACNTTHASCELDASVPGTCSYNDVACESGYHLSPDSPTEPYNMVCIPYAIKYDANNHGDGAVQDVLYNQTFRTNNAKDTDEFLWANHIVTAWTSVSGGNFPNVDAEYPYNVQSNTTLRANWGECHCTPGTNATACSTTSSNNQCQVNVITCATGFTGTSWSCNGTDCTANCSDSHNHTISLQHTLSGVTGGTTTIYSIDSGASSGSGVYLDNTHQQLMAVSGANSNPVTLPDSFAYTVTYDKVANDATLVGANSAQAVATFNGYYNSANGESLYISGDTGNITQDGIDAGTTSTSDQIWYGQWTLASVNLPVAYRPGYVFAGWFTQNGTTPVGNNEGQYTPGTNVALYAHWTECSAGNYCPGIETVNGEILYNTVYSCSASVQDGGTGGAYPNSVAGSDDISDCYLVLEDGKWVATAGAGKVDCTSGYYCNDHTTKVYYSNPGDNRRTTGIRNSCATNAGGTFAYTLGVGSTSINQCYKNVSLNKRGGSGTLGGANGVDNGSHSCYYDTNCTLPDASILQLTGHTFYSGWTDQADTDCNSTTRVFNVPNDTDTYYACRTTNAYTVTLKDGIDTNTTYGSVNDVAYGQPMPTVAIPERSASHTTYTFTGYYDNQQTSNSGVKYYNADGTSAKDWDIAQNANLYAWWDVGCDAGYYLPANSFVCTALCPAGKYCAGNETFSAMWLPWNSDQGISGDVAAGYYSTGGGTIATPTAAGNGCVIGNTCGIVNGGYYSTGGGTVAAPTGTGNGCLSRYACGVLPNNYFSDGGGTKARPLVAGNGCVSGQFCGICPEAYRASTATGKTNITACMAACSAGQRVVSAEDSTVNNPSAMGCETTSGNRWWSNAHNVYYGSISPSVSVSTDAGVHTCANGYLTPITTSAEDHDAMVDCKRSFVLNKNGGTTIEGATWPTGVTDPGGSSAATVTCSEGAACAFGNPAELLEKPGWTYQDAWGSNNDCTGDTYLSPLVTPTRSRYYACKTANEYTLTYACGDGATGPAPAQQTQIHYGDTVPVAAVGDCAKVGHHFTGWGVSDSQDVVQPGDMTWNYEESKTFTAQWAPNVYGVSYVDNGGVRTVPDGYTLVDYIESDGGQVIDTGIMGLDKRVVLDAMYTGTSESSYRIPVSYKYDYLGTYAAVYNNKWGVYNSSSYLISGAAINNRKTVEVVFDLDSAQSNKNRATITIGSTTKSYTRTGAAQSDGTLKLFAARVSVGSDAFIGRIYNAKIYDKDTGELLFNGVPARNSSDELGLYDMVSGTFFTNLGTGNPFTAGNDVTNAYPTEYTYGVGATVYGVPTRANSIFEGWCRDLALTENCTTPHVITTTDIDPKTLYAKWSCKPGYALSNDGQSCVGNEITIQYSKNGHGTESVPANRTCTYGSTVILANGLTEQGWWFMGWSVAGNTFDGGETIVCNSENLGVTSGTVTLVADWEPWCNKITLDKHSNDASYGSIRYLYGKTGATDGKWYKNDACTVEYTSADYESVKPVRSGWAFRGFYANSSDAADINATQTNAANRVMTHTGAPTDTTGQNFINAVNTDTVLYAGWAQDCASSISNGTCSRTIAQNTSYTTTCNTGYHYGTAPAGTYNPATQNNTSESTYNPICVPNTFKVYLNKNTGTGLCNGYDSTTDAEIDCIYGSDCVLPTWNNCTISKTGNLHMGWNAAADGSGATTYTYGDTLPSDISTGADVTLYAKWTPVDCRVENGTITRVVVDGNTPRCDVRCDSGYATSGVYVGGQHNPVVETNQCHEATYDIRYHENGGTRVLPDGFTLLEYVTADGNQYIDTGVKIKKSYEIRSKFKATELPKYLYAAVSSGNTASATAFVSSGSGAWRFGNKSLTKTLSLNTVYATIQNSGNLIINGTSSSYATVADFETPVTLALGAAHNADGTYGTAGFQGNIYEFRILDGNRNDVMNLVPMRRDSDGKVGFYDTVSGQFFTSIGSADFIAGPAISEEYTLLDYIQSSGTQYIVTDFVPTSDFKHTIVFEGLNSSSTSTYITGTTHTAGRAGNTRITSGKIDRVFGNDPSNSNSSSNYKNLINDSNNVSVVNTKSVLVMDLHNNAANTITLNGTDITSSNTGTITSTSALSLFAYGAGSYKSTIRLYRSTIEQGGVVVHNYVPARRNSDGELGVYDVITGNFFTNAGTGTFVASDTVLVSAQAGYPNEYMYGIGAMVYGVPVRAHSVFEGWCRNEALNEGCATPHEISTTDYGDKDLYAKWSCVNGYDLSDDGQSCVGNDITIVYQKGAHGVGNPPSAVTRPYGSTLTLADAMGDPQWTFTGWQINGNVYNEGENITLDFNTLSVYSGNVNAVAQWNANTYTVTYNCNTTWTPNTPPASGHPVTDTLFVAAGNTCVNPGYRFIGWSPTNDPTDLWPTQGDTWGFTSNQTFYAQWVRDDPAFTVTVTVPANTTFSFDTFASGQFWVDWNYVANPGVSVDEFETTTAVAHTWSHEYTAAGTYVIGIGGRASGYYTGADPYLKPAISFFNGTLNGTGIDATVTTAGTEQYIVSVNGSLGAVFPTIRPGTWGGQPRFYRTFKNTTAMTQSAGALTGLFAGINGTPVPYMFAETFDGSAIMGTIPAGLFPVSGAPQTSLFQSTFRNCTRLTGTIPAMLFANIAGNAAEYMFSRTFRGCTNLTGIPVGLFSGVTGAPKKSMFSYTFKDCSNITGTLSSNLFGSLNGAPVASMFEGTFENCSKLTGDTSSFTVAIPNGLFGTVGASTTGATYAFYRTFYGCSALNGTIGGALFGGLSGAPADHMFNSTFYGCSHLTGAIPQNLFGNMTGAPKTGMFKYTFYGCSELNGQIPNRLFGNITGAPASEMFRSTFYNCSGLMGVIPANLFENISGKAAESMFHGTFGNCSGLAGIGGALFSGINGSPMADYMFYYTFGGCTNLAGNIPDSLFGTPSGTAATYMFRDTFSGCSNLIGEIPSRLFGTPSDSATHMFRGTFRNCSSLTGTIPSTLFSSLSGAGKTNMFYETFLGCSNLGGYVPEGLFGDLSSGGTEPMYRVFADSGLLTECPCGTTDISASSPFYSAWQSTSASSNPKKVSCRVDTTPGDFYWYGGQCSTICPLDTIDELHVANLTPYPVLARKVTDVAINIKYGDTTCYVPLAAGNGGTNSLNMTYNNTVYHADRPGTTPPAGFGQR